MAHICRRFPIGLVLTLFVVSCATVPPDTTSSLSTSVKRDHHGLAEFDFGPDSLIDAILSQDLSKLTKAELLVRSNTLLLLDRQTIPGASGIGLIGVVGRPSESAVGWQCSNTSIEAQVAAAVDAAAAVAANRALAETHLAQFQRIRDTLPNLNAAGWRTAATAYMIARLKRYETSGKPEMEGLGKGMAWRSWMRATLVEINAKAKQSGLSNARKEDALYVWLICHISPSELERLRDVLKDRPAISNR